MHSSLGMMHISNVIKTGKEVKVCNWWSADGLVLPTLTVQLNLAQPSHEKYFKIANSVSNGFNCGLYRFSTGFDLFRPLPQLLYHCSGECTCSG